MADQRDDKLLQPARQDARQKAAPADDQKPAEEISKKDGGPLKNPAVRMGLLIGGLLILAMALLFLFSWWTHGRFVQSTNDAYLQADKVTIAPKIQGYVEKVFVSDNQVVKPGDPLVQIDTSTYQAALDQQLATVAARQADIVAAQKQAAQQTAALQQAQAQYAGAQATARFAQGEAARYTTLSAQGVETAERAATARNQADQANSQARALAAAVRQAQLAAAAMQSQVGQATAQMKAAQAVVESAQINLNDALIRASTAGRIGDNQVRVGQFVQPGTRLMDVVPTGDVYLVANFKETQIGRMRVGQVATVTLDALKGRKIEAVLDSFAPGTGAQFALLPPENATGNFTKIVQRVPVRFRLRVPDDVRPVLLPGLSATVKVDTTQPPVARQ